MPRPSRGPYLYLRTGKDRPPRWIIRDGPLQFGTGLFEDDRAKAEIALEAYGDARGQKPYFGLPRMAKEPDTVYFATCDAHDFPIKIGTTCNVAARVASMQTSLPYKVIVLATASGGLDLERSVHISHSDARLRGEWFRRTDALLAYIESLARSHQGRLIAGGR